MTDDQAVPLPPDAIEAGLKAMTGYQWYGAERTPSAIVKDVLAAAADVLRAEGAATERERWTARVDAVTVNLTRPRFTAPGQVTEAWIPLSELADLLDGTP